MPETLRGLGLMTGARRGGGFDRTPARGPSGDNGVAPFERGSLVMPRCCWRFDTRETREAFWLSYGDDGLIAKWPIPAFIRLSTLLRRESK
jgi:hypothetical protein